MSRSTSFTLIELLVVVVIIGILAGVIMLSTSSSINKASITKLKVFEESVSNNLAANMVSRWTLDQIAGAAAPYTTLDVWGNNIGTLYGAAGTQIYPQLQSSSQCITDGCFKFDGTDDYINCGNNDSLSMRLGDQTISMWIKFDNPALAQIQTLIVNGAGGSGAGNGGFWLYSDASIDSIYLNFSDGIVTRIGAYVANINDTNWHNLIITFDRDVAAKTYLDGISTGLTLNITGRRGDLQNSLSTRLGAYDSTQCRFSGLMDDVRIYNEALSFSRIKQNYIAGLDSLFSNGNISREEYSKRISALAYE